MRRVFQSTRHASIVAVLFALAACGGSQVQSTGAGLVPPQAEHGAAPLATKQFGVGLGDDAGADGNVGSKPSWRYDYCNGVLGNPSGCYSEVPGRRKFTSGGSGMVNLQDQHGQANGYVKAKISAVSKLGTGSYLLFGETNEKTKYYRNIGAQAQLVSSDWDDTFYISSGSLKKGSPVTIGVQLTLDATQTSIGCDSAQNSFGELNLYSPNVTPSSGSQFSISGYCINGSFEYYLYNNAKLTGTTATGTISTAVGDNFTFLFVATGHVIACQTTNYCVGDIGAKLGGNYTLTITSITPGATYTTASGNTYM
jgi:hypothetical protein